MRTLPMAQDLQVSRTIVRRILKEKAPLRTVSTMPNDTLPGDEPRAHARNTGEAHAAADNHVVATGIGVFVVCVVIAALALPIVRDLSLFESVYIWVCAPFVG